MEYMKFKIIYNYTRLYSSYITIYLLLIIYIYIYIIFYNYKELVVYASDINDAELFYAEPKLLVFDAETNFNFGKKKEPEQSRDFR